MSFKTRKNILNTIGALYLISGALFVYLHWFHFQNIAPTKPTPATGEIYEVNNHGWIFYLTKKQEIMTFVPCVVSVISFIALAALELRWKIYEQIYGKPRKLP